MLGAYDRTISAYVSCAVALLLLSGCGSDNDGAMQQDRAPAEASCFLASGARLARFPSDIAFFLRDERAGAVDASASALRDGINVVEYEPSAPRSGYLLYLGRPAGSNLHADEVLDRRPPRGFVVYIRYPDRRQASRLRRCMNQLAGLGG